MLNSKLLSQLHHYDIKFCDQKPGGSQESNYFIIPLYKVKDWRCQMNTGVDNLSKVWVRNQKNHTSQNGKGVYKREGQSRQEIDHNSSLKAFPSGIDTQEAKQSSICFSNVSPLAARSTCLGYFLASKENMEHSCLYAKG